MDGLQALLLREIETSTHFERLHEHLASAKPGKALSVKGLRGSSLPAVVSALARPAAKGGGAAPRLVVLVTSNYERSGEQLDDLQFFGADAGRVFHYPKTQLLPYDDDEPLLEEQVKHLEFLQFLAALTDTKSPTPKPVTGTPAAVCAVAVEALFQRVAPLSALRALALVIEWGQKLDSEDFTRRASRLGYERVPTVEARGEFAVRGGILDIFPLDAENPLRIDLFGDEIEWIRAFDTHTQRSIRGGPDIERVTVLPARERVLLDSITADGTALSPADAGPGNPLLTLFDLLPDDTLLVLDSPESYPLLDERFRQLAQRQFDHHGAERPDLPPPGVLYATLEQVEKVARRFVQVHHTLVVEGAGKTGVSFETSGFDTTKPGLEHYLTQIRRRVADGQTVVVVCDNDGQAQRMDDILRENVIGSRVFDPAKDPHLPAPDGRGVTRDVVCAVGLLHGGFIYPDAGLYLVTDREIFGRYKRRHVYRKIYKGAPVADAREIRKSDYVVHIEHGVGRFEGIRTQSVDGRKTDFLELIYADDDKLLVPVEKIAYVQKFSASEAAPPALDKLGSRKWAQRRSKSEQEVKLLAGELIELYARRAAAEGHAYGEDTLWQREFEASFLYTETPDQLRAINDVKRDMAGDKPMDRLVCGDVGYGKTEVAIRAAFKAIMDKRQVALLCPTTILAQQHFINFKERYADYPIKVGVLSRFQTAKEVKETLKGIADGTVNMVIGTHMLLSKNVAFKDLGLVVVDEEQRFGVSHKERLKEMRASVDFLTLTATPIPRTLYMALSGLRDMSIIQTPPADRHPIKTKIIHWDREQIEEAVLRELNRGGQVFFVHNRVQNIHQIAEKIREIVPTARIAVGHGQMHERDLEQVMIDFIDRKFDILVSTTIIESGVDIPNCNTIIVNRADAFGLAQLYQIRGRVGRENRRAYAYLVVPAGEAITEHAVARLQAIEEFTELGVGFNIAMRDMEIRGTGNLLGKEQHGTMNAVGFELYCRMLEEAVDDMRGREREEAEREVEISWKATAYIPPEFVPVESQRVMLYKRIAEAKTLEQLDEVAGEIKDRYGEVARVATGTATAAETARARPVAVAEATYAAAAAVASNPDAGMVAGGVALSAAAAAKAAMRAAAAAKRAAAPAAASSSGGLRGSLAPAPARPADEVIIEDLPVSVENLFAIARLRLLGRKLALRKVTGMPKGFKLHHPTAILDLGPLVKNALPAGRAKVFADDPGALEFHYEDWAERGQLLEAVRVMKEMAQSARL